MSLSSTSPGRRPARLATALAVALAVLAPLAVLGAQVWSRTEESLAFTADERRGADYLGPLTVLLSATVEAQSAAVRGRRVDVAAVRTAVAGVDEADRRLGGELRTTERWAAVRRTVEDRTGRTWDSPTAAYAQFGDLVTALLELNRVVGDNSRLILDPSIDAYYVMNASLLRIPAILVDSGRYADLSVLSAGGSGRTGATMQAQLAAARNRVATDAADLSDGLVTAFGSTTSSSLGPALTRQLDNFRTAVDAVAPSTSLLAPEPTRSAVDRAADQAVLVKAALDLQAAALGQLDRLLADRAGGERTTRTVGAIALVLGVLVAVGTAVLLARRGPEPPAGHRETTGRHTDLIGAGPVRTSGGARAAR
jgi:hypothetical protein